MAAKQLAASSLGAPADTYLYSLAVSAHQTTHATIGSDDSLRLFDSSLRSLNTITPCHRGVACLAASSSGFITSGRDGLIKVWSSQGQQISLVSEPQGRGISAIASCGDQYVAAGTESTNEGLGDVAVLVYDLRNLGQPLRKYSESHTDTITQLVFHPTQPNVLLSASTDGLVSFFDINQDDEDDALQQVLNPRSAVHCAGLLTDDQAYVLTTDERFSVYPLAENSDGATDPTVDFGDVREQLGCTYVVGVYQQPNSSPFLAYGHNGNQTLGIVELGGGPTEWKFGQGVDLPGAHGEDIVRDILLANDTSKVYTCGEDGQVRVWQLSSSEGGPMSADSKPPKKRKDKKSERFAPY